MKSSQSATNLYARKLEIPEFEKSADEILKNVQKLMTSSRSKIEEIKSQSDKDIGFDNSFAAFDTLQHAEEKLMSRIYFLQNVHPDSEIREAARKAQIEYQNFSIERAYDMELYRIFEKAASKVKDLGPVEKKLVEDHMRDYRRMGMQLPSAERQKVQELKKELSRLETEFSSNIQEHSDFVLVEASRLKGLDSGFIENLKKDESGLLKVSLDYPEFFPVMEHAEDEELRKELLIKKYRAAGEKNSSLLEKIVSLRKQISGALGYTSWNHYIIEERMAKTPERVFDFLNELKDSLQSKARLEMEELSSLKREHTQNPGAKIEFWDFYFYTSLYKKKKFEINSQELKEYFSLTDVITSMFEICGRLFQLDFKEVKPEEFYQWHEDARLVQVIDRATQQPLSYFYLDLHPRPGKYNHAAAFGLISGKLLSDGSYQAPVSAMVCNFPRPSQGRPSLIPHPEVETLFHEFGHILHGVLSQAEYARFSGTSVARDFVEAPSQVMENWVWQEECLKLLAKHYKTGESLSPELIDRMNQAKRAGTALFYLRQISLALADMEIHGEKMLDPIQTANRVMSEVFLPTPSDTCFAASWGHMVGYASGYYGYAWADVMAADLFSKFHETEVMNEKLGLKLRKEIFETGGSRDENISLESFLDRPLSAAAFYRDLGVPTHV